MEKERKLLKKDHPLFHCYSNMKKRCSDKNDPSFPSYGGRNIRVCEEWERSFDSFVRDMGQRPSLKHTIDRIDNNGNYEPSNCRWATVFEQQNNRRNNVKISYLGKEQTIAEWSRELNISPSLIGARLGNGLPLEQVFLPANHSRINPKKIWTFEGIGKTFSEWTKELNLARTGTLKKKMVKLGSFEEAVRFFKKGKRSPDWAKCSVCDKFISFKDFSDGNALKIKISDTHPKNKCFCRDHKHLV